MCRRHITTRLKRATLTYSLEDTVSSIVGEFSITCVRELEIDGKRADRPSEKERCQRFIDKLRGVAVEITLGGKSTPFDEAFDGTETFYAPNGLERVAQ